MPDSQRRVLYEFDRFTVDPNQRRLIDAATSAPIELPPRAFDALLYLVERPGELLSKREFMHALWPGIVVEENNLNQVISLLRKLLGEKPSEHRFIVTAPGRGYRFVATVRTRGRSSPAELERNDFSVAVLPFADHSDVAGNDYLGDAIAADLNRLLSARGRIRVAAHASSSAFKSNATDARTVAETLNVARIVSGQVARAGEQLTVTARLIDARSGQQIRTSTHTRHVRDLVELQADLAREIAWALDPESATAVNKSSATDPDAYMRYLHALSLSMRRDANTVMKSIALLREAIERDPLFSRAKSLLAIQYTTCVMFGFPLPGALDMARHEVAGALVLDDQNGETHCAAGVIDCLSGAWCRAEERFRIAHSMSADPLFSGLRCAYLTMSVGQVQRGVQQAEHALRVAPTHSIGVSQLAALHQAMSQDAQAYRYAELAAELGQSRTLAPLADIFSQLALRAGRSGDAAACMAATFPARMHSPEFTQMLEWLCRPSFTRSESAEAGAAIRAVEDALSIDELDPPMRKRLIFWYSRIGELERAYELAFKSLDHYAREGTVGGAWGVLWLPEMRPFRDDERFQLFARRLRLFEYWSEYGPADGYSLDGDRLSKVE